MKRPQKQISYYGFLYRRAIYDHGVTTIVMLNISQFKEETCVPYWPCRKGSEKFDQFIVTLREAKETAHITIRTMLLANSSKPQDPEREVHKFFNYTVNGVVYTLRYTLENFSRHVINLLNLLVL